MKTRLTNKFLRLGKGYLMSYFDSATGEIFLPWYEVEMWNTISPLFSKEKVVNALSNYAHDFRKIEVYPITDIEDAVVMLSALDDTRSAIMYVGIKDMLSKIRNLWDSADEDECNISDESSMVLKNLMKMKRDNLSSRFNLTPQQALGRMDVLLRKRYNIRKRKELSFAYFHDAINFIFALDGAALETKASRMKKV